MFKQRIAWILLLIVLVLAPVAARADSIEVSNPMKGIEIDLTAADMLAATLKFNDIILHRLEVSSEARWMTDIAYPKATSADEEHRLKKYEDSLYKEMKRDFYVLSYYGEIDLAEMIDVFSISGAANRVVLEMLKQLGLRIEHAQQILDYHPEGCITSDFYNYSSDRGAVFHRYCTESSSLRKGKCQLFSDPLEDVMYQFMISGKITELLNTRVDSLCLTRAESVSSFAYRNVEEAFNSMLPVRYLKQIQAAEAELQSQSDRVNEIEIAIKEIEAKQSDPAHKAESAELGRELTAKKMNLSIAQKDVDRSKALISGLYSDAAKDAEVTPENVALASRLLPVLNYVNTNCNIAIGGLPTVLAKAGYDVYEISGKHDLALKIAGFMAAEAVVKGMCRDVPSCMNAMTTRVQKIFKKSVAFIPNIVTIGTGIYTQKYFMSNKIDYLDKIIAADANYQEMLKKLPPEAAQPIEQVLPQQQIGQDFGKTVVNPNPAQSQSTTTSTKKKKKK